MLAKLFCLDPKEKIAVVTEVMGGITNFMAIAYIIAVNPLILNANGGGFPLAPAITATVLIIVIMTLIAAFFIKLPFVLAPGMGINAIIAYTLILHDKLDIPTVLGVVLISSSLLLLFSVTRVRQLIIHAIPEFLQIALSAGIGFFLFMIGAKNLGLIVSNANTIIGIGHFNFDVVLGCLGFVSVAALFIKRKVYAFLLPLVLITLISALVHESELPHQYLALPDFSLFMHIDLLKALQLSVLPSILALFVVNFFDATSTTMGLLAQMKFVNQHLKMSYLKRTLITDSVGGMVAAVFGVSPCVIFVESSAAIQGGARTGLAAMVSALLCLPFILLAPLIAIIPVTATSPILMVVGLIMLSNIKQIKFKHFEDVLASSVTVIMMPLCFSITAGAIFGVLTYTVLKLLLGKYQEVSPTLMVVASLCCGWFFIN